MNDSADKTTTHATLTIVLLREIRHERGMHQAVLADRIGISPSGWAKIETGKNSLSIDMLFRVCRALEIWPSHLITSVERHTQFLYQHGIHVLASDLGGNEHDYLLAESQRYYSSPGLKRRMMSQIPSTNYLSTLNNSPYVDMQGNLVIVDVLRFLIDKNFQDGQIQESIPSRW